MVKKARATPRVRCGHCDGLFQRGQLYNVGWYVARKGGELADAWMHACDTCCENAGFVGSCWTCRYRVRDKVCARYPEYSECKWHGCGEWRKPLRDRKGNLMMNGVDR